VGRGGVVVVMGLEYLHFQFLPFIFMIYTIHIKILNIIIPSV